MKKLVKSWVGVMAAVALVAGGCQTQQSAELVSKGDNRMLLADYSGAADHYEEAVTLNPNAATHLRLAVARVKLGQYGEALVPLGKLGGETSPRTDYLAAVCHLNLGDVPRAEERLTQALAVNPADPLALALLGRIRFLQKRYPETVAAYQKALAVSSQDSVRTKVYYNLAVAQLLSGQFIEADASFREYLSQQNHVGVSDKKLGGAMAYATGDHSRAYKYWQNLSAAERREILDAIADESQAYDKLASAN